jgi:glyoxylase-like metal-dependent hydrolase (beta-lactamase superfamily II)
MIAEWERTLGAGSAALQDVGSGVARLPIVFVNAYLLGDANEWVLVDSGLPGTAARTHRAAEARFGRGTRPAAIVLTHGHFDHAGAALELARRWNVSIYAHPLELPYLTGRSDYPPQDPTVGGAIAQMSRVFPTSGYNFSDRVLALPADGSVPSLPGWRWLHTPGHTPGHVSLYRAEDRFLLAGDAVTTMDLDSWTAQLTREPEFDRPPAPFTPDWQAAEQSVRELAELAPHTVAAGHGVPLSGPAVAARLRSFAERFPVPRHGRYIGHPALADENGLVAVPPPVPDPFPARLAVGAVAAVLLVALQRKR